VNVVARENVLHRGMLYRGLTANMESLHERPPVVEIGTFNLSQALRTVFIRKGILWI
jgi:hypothetical protein